MIWTRFDQFSFIFPPIIGLLSLMGRANGKINPYTVKNVHFSEKIFFFIFTKISSKIFNLTPKLDIECHFFKSALPYRESTAVHVLEGYTLKNMVKNGHFSEKNFFFHFYPNFIQNIQFNPKIRHRV